MNRLGIGLVIATALVATACGTSGSDKATPKATTAPVKVSLADACPKVQDALNTASADKGMLIEGSQFYAFDESLRSLIDGADPKAVPILESLSNRTQETGDAMGSADGTGRLVAATDWLKSYKRVMDACQAVGAPITLPNS